MRQTIILLSLLVPLTLLTACSGNSKQKEEAKINAAVVAELGDVLKSDFNDAISRIDHSGMYSRDDVFGNSHDFTSKERALNYITSINGATLFVMDSLQLQIEEAAVNNESDRQLDKLNKLVKKYIDVCRHPAAAPDKLLKTCKSISDAIRETIKVAGNPDEKAVKDRIGLCGAAVMRRELAAAQKASDANAETRRARDAQCVLRDARLERGPADDEERQRVGALHPRRTGLRRGGRRQCAALCYAYL